MGENYALELRDISKRFGSVQANDHVNLTLRKSEILAILGENGSGKTTLMNMIYGIYYPDEGHIFVNGKEVTIRSPKDSYELGIGMVHQHFKLVDVLTAAENIVLGLPGKGKLDMKKITEDIQKLVDKYGFELDLSQKIYEMSVSQKQTVEIIKMLYRGARILILDEPTAVLTPQEADRLFDILRNMRKDGCSIMIITHKLQEVLALSDRVAILRKGKYIDTVETARANAQSLSEMMVGGRVDLNIDRPEPENVKPRLIIKGLNCKDKDDVKTLDDIEVRFLVSPEFPEADRKNFWRRSQDFRSWRVVPSSCLTIMERVWNLPEWIPFLSIKQESALPLYRKTVSVWDLWVIWI